MEFVQYVRTVTSHKVVGSMYSICVGLSDSSKWNHVFNAMEIEVRSVCAREWYELETLLSTC